MIVAFEIIRRVSLRCELLLPVIPYPGHAWATTRRSKDTWLLLLLLVEWPSFVLRHFTIAYSG